MPSNPTPNLSQSDLRKLDRLLDAYAKHIRAEQPLAAQIIATVSAWVRDDIETDVPRPHIFNRGN